MKHVERVWDTVVSVHLHGGTAADQERARDAVVAWVHRVDALLSTFRPDSALSRWHRGDLLWTALPTEVREVLELAEEARVRTAGAFDPHWSGGAPDPTGLVKGWAADRAVALAVSRGVSGVQVNAGGDVRTAGSPGSSAPWRLGVAAPGRPRHLIDVVEGHDLAVATSGTTSRGAHVLRAGRPARELLAVTVVGPDAARADAYSTAALACATPTALLDELDGDGWPSLRVTADGDVRVTVGWPGLHVRPEVPA